MLKVHRISSRQLRQINLGTIQKAFQRLTTGNRSALMSVAVPISLASFYKPVYVTVKHNKELNQLELFVQGEKVADHCGLAAKLLEVYGIENFYFKRILPKKVSGFFEALMNEEDDVLSLVDKNTKGAVEALVERAEFLLMVGKEAEAVARLQQAVVVDPNDPVVLSMLNVLKGSRPDEYADLQEQMLGKPIDKRNLVRLGKICLGAKEYEEAELYFLQSCRGQKPNMQWLKTAVLLVECYKRQNKFAQAVSLLMSFVEVDPANAFLQKNLLVCAGHAEMAKDAAVFLARNVQSGKIKAFSVDYRLLMDLGKIYIKLRNFEMAEKCLTDALKMATGFSRDITESFLINCYLGMKAGEKAQAILARYVELNPENVIYLTNMARALMMQNKYSEAIPYLRRCMVVEPGNPFNIAALIKCLELINDNKQLEEFLLTALSLEQVKTSVLRRAAIFLMSRGRFDAASRYLEVCLQKQPDNVCCLGELASCFREQDKYALAAKYLQRCVELEPDNVVTLCNLGNCLIRIGEINTALYYLEKAVRLAPNDNKALSSLAFCQTMSGDSAAAIRTAREITFDPQNPTERLGLAMTLMQSREYNEAIANFERCLELGIENQRYVRLMVSKCFFSQRKFYKAKRLLGKLLVDFPNDPEVLFGLAKCFYGQKKFDMAIRLLDKIIENNPANGYALHEKAECLRKLKKYDEAIVIFKLVLDNFPDGSGQNGKIDVFNGLGYCYLELIKEVSAMSDKGKYAHLAVTTFNEAKQIGDRSLIKPRTCCGLGFVYLAMANLRTHGREGNFRKARECFEEALAIDPENPKAQGALASLTRLEQR